MVLPCHATAAAAAAAEVTVATTAEATAAATYKGGLPAPSIRTSQVTPSRMARTYLRCTPMAYANDKTKSPSAAIL